MSDEEKTWREAMTELRALGQRMRESMEAGKELDYSALPRLVEKMPFLGEAEELERLAVS